ncbi:hypothetical protein BJF87_02460 [Gordonia sp. CNJ-863]|uniref:hypothetical protein n=1 Tax=Gordonia TaxID=2053 RepID=UPI00096606E2|nr:MULTISPECIES: hypothetical protein [Gordonia]MDH3018421.1 hypothetical protein [Gordonia alkanivorans]MDJ0008967.1 hypothetical protein [Gordonia alkanivorans]MDJ0098090.1 hypothetical protein [Gordonia alkanivorans]MDJ0494542.1 hypothetical protein [Gordonia alkanivorans]OLT47166.1 hypothetical protein BJF87_02460 [Gordonia sp. CNJ-863]
MADPPKTEHGTVGTHAPNDPEDWSWPAVDTNLAIRFDHLDGEVIGPLLATDVTDYKIYNHGGKPSEERTGWMSDDNIAVFVTEARLAYACPDLQTEGGPPRTATAGHIRFPWVCMLEFTTKQNWLTYEILRVFYEDHEGLKVFEMIFDKREKAASLATILVQRIAAYQLASTTPKEPSTVRQLQSLRELQQLPVPKKFEFTTVDIPGYSSFGTGQDHAPADAPSRLLAHSGSTPEVRTECTPPLRALKFNPPPTWPSPPTGWTPGPDWQPDPAWPTPPPGWKLWVE